jgi:hypothetical protein
MGRLSLAAHRGCTSALARVQQAGYPARMLNASARRVIARLALVFAAIAVAFLLAEGALRLGLRQLPVRLHTLLPQPIRVVAQNTYGGLHPRHYIALAGDSCARGLGDAYGNRAAGPAWLGLASILHDRLQRDVLSFGADGAGSLRGIVGAPIANLTTLNATALLHTPEPDTWILCFYEGNDLNNNLVDLQTRYFPTHDRERLGDPAYFQQFIQSVVIGNAPYLTSATNRPWLERSLLYTALATRLRMGGAPSVAVEPHPLWHTQTNLIGLAGAPTPIPGHLQGPALELHDEEIAGSTYVFGQSVQALMERFPQASFWILYIPSVLTCYAPASPTVSMESHHYRQSQYPAEQVATFSTKIFDEIARIAAELDIPIIDSRPTLQAVARDRLIHGPRDWYHLNAAGYEALGNLVARALLSSPGGSGSAPTALPNE